MSNIKDEAYEASKEIVNIIKKNYVNNAQFRAELISALNRKTGNDRLGMLCDSVISELQKNKIVT
jgi:hypothetical protein